MGAPFISLPFLLETYASKLLPNDGLEVILFLGSS
jgi:hypothetical protein